MTDKGTPTHELKPNPDPSVLTTEQLLREIDRAEKVIVAQIDGHKEVVKARFDQVDREFELIEARRLEQKTDTKVAVDAALSAAKDAVKEQTIASEKSIIKSETSSSEQSKQQNATVTASIKGVVDTLNDLKDRVNRIEAVKVGSSEYRDTARLDMGTVIALLSLAAVVVFALIK